MVWCIGGLWDWSIGARVCKWSNVSIGVHSLANRAEDLFLQWKNWCPMFFGVFFVCRRDVSSGYWLKVFWFDSDSGLSPVQSQPVILCFKNSALPFSNNLLTINTYIHANVLKRDLHLYIPNILNRYNGFKPLTHWDRDKMAAISKTAFSNVFSCQKIGSFWFKFHWNLFIRSQWTWQQH